MRGLSDKVKGVGCQWAVISEQWAVMKLRKSVHHRTGYCTTVSTGTRARAYIRCSSVCLVVPVWSRFSHHNHNHIHIHIRPAGHEHLLGKLSVHWCDTCVCSLYQYYNTVCTCECVEYGKWWIICYCFTNIKYSKGDAIDYMEYGCGSWWWYVLMWLWLRLIHLFVHSINQIRGGSAMYKIR